MSDMMIRSSLIADQAHQVTSAGGKNLRVLLWSPKGAGLHYNGPGTSAYRLYARARDYGLDATLAHGFSGQPTNDVFNASYLIAGLFNADLTPVAPRAIAHLRFVLRAEQWLRRNAQQFDVFHGLAAYDYTVRPAIAAERYGVPAVVKIAQHRAELADKRNWRSMIGVVAARRKLLSRVSGVIAISREIRNELLEYGVPESRVATIPNGVRLDQFYPVGTSEERSELRRRLGWPDRPTIIFVGSIVSRKQPHLLVHALHKLLQRRTDCQLVLAGPEVDPSYAEAIRGFVRSYALERHVRWTGFVTDPAALLRAADIFVLPSRNEGMANAALEALATGLPLILTNVSGSSDIVKHGENGVLSADNAVELTEYIAQYLRDSKLRQEHGAASRARAKKIFGADAVLAAHKRLFDGIRRGLEPAQVLG